MDFFSSLLIFRGKEEKQDIAFASGGRGWGEDLVQILQKTFPISARPNLPLPGIICNL